MICNCDATVLYNANVSLPCSSLLEQLRLLQRSLFFRSDLAQNFMVSCFTLL